MPTVNRLRWLLYEDGGVLEFSAALLHMDITYYMLFYGLEFVNIQDRIVLVPSQPESKMQQNMQLYY